MTQIHFDVTDKVHTADQETWLTATAAAKAGCLIFRLLNTIITMDASMEG